MNVILGWGLPILIVLAGLLYWLIPTLIHPAAPENATLPVSSDIEAQYGIRISRVAVTADGGMVDVRYVVLDPEKAHDFAIDAGSTPILYAQTGNITISETAPMPHKDVLHAGTTYFLLYHNTTASIKPRSYIKMVLGKFKLESVPVR
jgi:hypothetical protein